MVPANSRKRRAAQPSEREPPSKRVQQTRGPAVSAAPTQQKLRVFVFGDGTSGELGLGSQNSMSITRPRVNKNLGGVVGVATGGMHAAAITADGQVLTWGVNDQCALGRDTTWEGGKEKEMDDDSDSDDDVELNPLESTPTAIANDGLPQDFKALQVAACDSATFILSESGLVYGCGTFRDQNGIFGFRVELDDHLRRQLVVFQKTPRLLQGLQKTTSLCAGPDLMLALNKKGSVYSWGGESNRLGRPAAERHRSNTLVPTRVKSPRSTKIVSVHTGNDHAFAIDFLGHTWAWGLNNFGQTGIAQGVGEAKASIPLLQKVPALLNKQMKVIGGGRHHSIGVTSTGKCLAWGRLDGGQLGLSISDLPITDPTKILLNEMKKPAILLEPTALQLPPCDSVAVGTDHSFAITGEGKAYSWGFNANGQYGQGNEDDVNVATLMESKSVREEKIVWAGAGGQYGMLAALA